MNLYSKKKKRQIREIDKNVKILAGISNKFSPTISARTASFKCTNKIFKTLRPSPSRTAKLIGTQSFLNLIAHKRELKFVYELMVNLNEIDKQLTNVGLKFKTVIVDVSGLKMNNCGFDNFLTSDDESRRKDMDDLAFHETILAITIPRLDQHIGLLEELVMAIIRMEDLSFSFYEIFREYFHDNDYKTLKEDKIEAKLELS